MEDEVDFEKCADPLMIILNSLELIKLQYEGVMDDGIKIHLNRIDKSAQKIERLLQELKTKHKIYN